jgi:hypothetical protein
MELTPNEILFAGRLGRYLKIKRNNGQITPERKANSIQLVAAAKESDVDLKREDIYRLIHFLREQNVPIVSGQTGYCYALEPEEFDECIAEQKAKLKETQETLSLLIRLQDNLRKTKDDLFQTEAGKVLADNLDLSQQTTGATINNVEETSLGR